MYRTSATRQAVLALTVFEPGKVRQSFPFFLNLKEVMMKFQFVQHHEPWGECVDYGNPKGEFDDRNNPELVDHMVKVLQSLYMLAFMHDIYCRHSTWPIV